MSTARFSTDEIQLARQLRDAGLDWTPGVGQFVYDEIGAIDAPSPFQERVYFILDMRHFLRRVETIAGMRAAFFWLPEYAQARDVLATLGVSSQQVRTRLQDAAAVEHRTELLTLYRLIHETLTARRGTADASSAKH